MGKPQYTNKKPTRAERAAEKKFKALEARAAALKLVLKFDDFDEGLELFAPGSAHEVLATGKRAITKYLTNLEKTTKKPAMRYFVICLDSQAKNSDNGCVAVYPNENHDADDNEGNAEDGTTLEDAKKYVHNAAHLNANAVYLIVPATPATKYVSETVTTRNVKVTEKGFTRVCPR